MMDESIDGGNRHRLVGEDGSPIGKWAVAGNDETAMFVALSDEFEQHAGLGLVLACGVSKL